MNFKRKSNLKNLLITGCYRTGTTLIEKLVQAHPEVCIASQPFPVLYFYLKNVFYDSLALERLYPLGPLFLESSYNLEDFYNFLDRYQISKNDIIRIFSELKEYKRGLWTPEILSFREQLNPGYFFDVYSQLNGFIPEIFSKEDVCYTGGKEILCEEYVPYLLSNGVKIIIIVRDPRDVITSLNFRKKDNLTGDKRPVLYSLRLWRKSIAFALECEDNENFMWLKYEDLVEKPIKILSKIAGFLDINVFGPDVLEEGIRDQYGDLWSSNSSFLSHKRISGDSIGRFETVLPEYVVSYIEACCLPEMKYLNYDLNRVQDFDEKALRDFKEPFPIEHEKFLSNKDYSLEHIDEEIERYGYLKGSLILSDNEARKWFLFEKVYKKYLSVFK